MYNCAFTCQCIEDFCDKSCPIFAETSYLSERNNIDITNPVFSDRKDSSWVLEFLEQAEGKLVTYVVKGTLDTVKAATLLTHGAICKYWKGSRLHCEVYNFKYSQYLELLKKSWNSKTDPEQLEYMKIWSESARVLIISNLDYISFGDFESQTLLNLIQSRSSSNLTTIFVTPKLGSLVCTKSSSFFNMLISKLKEASKVVSV